VRIDQERSKKLDIYQNQLGINFQSKGLLNLAFLHRSYANEKSIKKNNERLEFLGDSVLSLVICQYLYDRFPDKTEGELARIKAVVVSETILYEIAKKIDIGYMILMSKNEEKSGGREKATILADCFEAVIGAYYLDIQKYGDDFSRDFNQIHDFIIEHFKEEIEKVLQDKHKKNYKALLQEQVQKIYKKCPEYVTRNSIGPDHDKIFYVEVFINNSAYGVGSGKSKKEAEQEAAKAGLANFNSIEYKLEINT